MDKTLDYVTSRALLLGLPPTLGVLLSHFIISINSSALNKKSSIMWDTSICLLGQFKLENPEHNQQAPSNNVLCTQ
jgi:hypothetical protein